MRNCDEILDLISAELDGELAEEEKAALYAHLEQCENCRRYRDALREMSDALENDLAEPPAALAQNVMERVSAVSAPAKKPARIRYLRPLRGAALAAVAVLAIWTGARLFAPKGATASAPTAAADMAAAESAESPAETMLGEDMSRAAGASGATAPYAEPAEAPAAPMEMPAAEEGPTEGEFAYSDAGTANSLVSWVEVYRRGELLLQTDDMALLDFLQEEVLFAVDSVDIPEGEAEYVLLLCREDGSVESVTIWFMDDALCWHRDTQEIACLSPVTTENFIAHMPQ